MECLIDNHLLLHVVLLLEPKTKVLRYITALFAITMLSSITGVLVVRLHEIDSVVLLVVLLLLKRTKERLPN